MADIEQVVEEVLKQVGVKCFKDEQRMILDCMFEKKDCVAVLPTDFGKSLPFQAYLPVKRALLRTGKETDELIEAGKVVIIHASPESLVGDGQWISTIQRLNVTDIVVD
ncbi:uncharacterized protein LOC130049786 [Ostrea edulis]|uniref:uncharacterized protein LOC130049786 n=1 Tax=Ostrea edulis TaxID=37623 RepID=UPI0024AF6FF8|nr:uncharacterized protein LOC130049786 [Ostrea edulis]